MTKLRAFLRKHRFSILLIVLMIPVVVVFWYGEKAPAPAECWPHHDEPPSC